MNLNCIYGDNVKNELFGEQSAAASNSNSTVADVHTEGTDGINSGAAPTDKKLEQFEIKTNVPKTYVLDVDDNIIVKKNCNSIAENLISSLFIVHVPDEGDDYFAWSISGMDLDMQINMDKYLLACQNDIIMSMFVNIAENNLAKWRKLTHENLGTTYLSGPNAYEAARSFFNIAEENVTMTEKGPISVTFDIATRTFHSEKKS